MQKVRGLVKVQLVSVISVGNINELSCFQSPHVMAINLKYTNRQILHSNWLSISLFN